MLAPVSRKRPAAAMGTQPPPSLGPVWQWRCNISQQASCLGVERPDRLGAPVSQAELVEALPPGTEQASGRVQGGAVAARRSQRHLEVNFEMPPHDSHRATYYLQAKVNQAQVQVFGPREPRGRPNWEVAPLAGQPVRRRIRGKQTAAAVCAASRGPAGPGRGGLGVGSTGAVARSGERGDEAPGARGSGAAASGVARQLRQRPTSHPDGAGPRSCGGRAPGTGLPRGQ